MFQPGMMPANQMAFASMWMNNVELKSRGQNMLIVPLLKDVCWVFGMYLIYVLIGGVCFMAIER